MRGWQLMCMCVGTFPPSRDFENYLINFILDHKDGAGAIGNYARYSLRRLEGILNSGPSGFVPSVDEILAYKERPPILATIELVDGTPLTEDLPITPDLNVGKVLDICVHFLELSDPRSSYFGVFVEDVDDPDAPGAGLAADSDDAPPYAGLPKTPRPLQSENFMGDVVTVKVRQNQPFKFVFKRKIFLKNADEPSSDPMYERLIYLQVRTGAACVSRLSPTSCCPRVSPCTWRSDLFDPVTHLPPHPRMPPPLPSHPLPPTRRRWTSSWRATSPWTSRTKWAASWRTPWRWTSATTCQLTRT